MSTDTILAAVETNSGTFMYTAADIAGIETMNRQIVGRDEKFVECGYDEEPTMLVYRVPSFSVLEQDTDWDAIAVEEPTRYMQVVPIDPVQSDIALMEAIAAAREEMNAWIDEDGDQHPAIYRALCANRFVDLRTGKVGWDVSFEADTSKTILRDGYDFRKFSDSEIATEIEDGWDAEWDESEDA